MHLFNASSLFNEDGIQELLRVGNNPEALQNALVRAKKALLRLYHFSAYHVPDDFTVQSYIIAANHLTDSDIGI